ncbi:MAG TPA: efflux RND transporter periplasmic adaptor subunit [Gemmataceae bacterium]|nr:efflux RND transporter periplasmic adaptor subunit [Gemmataceae bacterium]
MNETGNNGPAQPALSERVRSLRLADNGDTNGSGWRSWIPWAVCGLLFCATTVFAMEALSPISDDLIKTIAKERGLDVGAVPAAAANPGSLMLPGSAGPSASASSGDIALESKGYIIPFKLIQVSPKITGTVLKLNIKEGNHVQKGFVLAELEDVEFKSDYLHCVASARAAKARIDELKIYRDEEIRQAKADMDEAAAQLQQMLLKFNRTLKLKERNAVAIEDYEAAVSSHDSMKARVERLRLSYELLQKGPRDAKIAAAEGDYHQAEADVLKAKWRFDNTRILAPITGVILSKKTEEGNLVNPSAFSSGLSASLCEMADLYDLEVDLSIAERDIAKVFDKQECRLHAEAFPDRLYRGYVSRIMPTADRSKASVPVRVCVQFPALDRKGQPLPKEQQGEFLRPDMGAIVTFLNRKATNFEK